MTSILWLRTWKRTRVLLKPNQSSALKFLHLNKLVLKQKTPNDLPPTWTNHCPSTSQWCCKQIVVHIDVKRQAATMCPTSLFTFVKVFTLPLNTIYFKDEFLFFHIDVMNHDHENWSPAPTHWESVHIVSKRGWVSAVSADPSGYLREFQFELAAN